MTSSEFADVTLVTDDKHQIQAHRTILSAASPVFKNIFENWTTSTENVPMCPDLLFIISNKSYISEITG